MADLDLCFLSASDIADQIRNRKLSPVEVVKNSLERIDEVNPILNCFCFTYPEEALKQAHALEAAIEQGKSPGPLAGVPIALKDFTPIKGKTTTRGSALLKDWVPDYDSVLTERLLQAGAILVGKTTIPEFAASGFTRSLLWGETRNPWNPECTPGGSSGGSGAAVASGCVPLAEGTDMGVAYVFPQPIAG